jgi:hypothetical protein
MAIAKTPKQNALFMIAVTTPSAERARKQSEVHENPLGCEELTFILAVENFVFPGFAIFEERLIKHGHIEVRAQPRVDSWLEVAEQAIPAPAQPGIQFRRE